MELAWRRPVDRRRVQSNAELHAAETYPDYVHVLTEKGIDVHPLNIEKDSLPFGSSTVDVIIANQILEHVKEVYWIFHEISRVLTVGGKIIVGVPNLAALHSRILLTFGKQPSSINTASAHIRGFTKMDVLRFLENCFPGGYKICSFGGGNFYPFPPIIAKPLAIMFPTMAAGIFFLFEKKREYKNEFLEFPVNQRLETNFYLEEQ